MMKRSFWTNLFDKLTNFLFPKKIKCVFCGKDINNFEEKPYCDDCEKNLPFNNGHRCKLCDMEILETEEVCEICKHSHKPFDKVRATFKYENQIKHTVLKFKSNNGRYLTEPMAKLMFQSLPDDMLDFDFVVPVPMTEKSVKARGYNQALLLAKEISALSDKTLKENILLKIKDTAHQKELNFKDRQKNLVGAFKIANRKELKNKVVLLVDDVMTTSATATVCCDLLKRHCRKVYVVTFARNTINFDKKTKKFSKNA